MALPLGFPLSPDEMRVAAFTEEFAAASIAPLAEIADERDEPHPDMVKALRGSGLFEHFVPVEHGGAGLSVVKLCLMRERLAFASVAADEFFASQGIAVQPIVLFGTDEQKQAYLPPFLAGARSFAFCLTEPGAGSDVLGIRATARETSAGFILNGVKRYVFQAQTVDTLVLFAKTGLAEERGNITAFLFDRPAAGCTARPFLLLGPGPEGELQFDDCLIPSDSVLGQTGGGGRVALGNLDRLRPSVGAAAVGMAQRALDEVAAYLQRRHAFGHPLSEFQGLRFRLAEVAAELEAARLLVYGAARVADSETDPHEVRAASAKAKLLATEVAQRVIDTALQFHGGVGLRRGGLMERLYRGVRAMRIYEGSSEVMKVVIARSLLGREAENR